MSDARRDIELLTRTEEQTALAGKALGAICRAGDLVALQGELGAGKTQLVRGLAQGMGIDPRRVSSPTFVMAQEYEPKGGGDDGRPILVHIDAYRIHSDEDLASIGWHGHGEELREDAVLAVEWASLIEPALGEDVLWVEIAHESDGRRIVCSARGAWRARMPLLNQSFRDAALTLAEPGASTRQKGAEP